MPLIPRDEGFFGLFNQLAEKMKAASNLLRSMFESPERLKHFVAEIKKVFEPWQFLLVDLATFAFPHHPGDPLKESLGRLLTPTPEVPHSIAGDDDKRAAYCPEFNEGISDKTVFWLP